MRITNAQTERLLLALTIKCPICGVPVGTGCIDVWNRYGPVWWGYHYPRWRDAVGYKHEPA